VVLCGLADDGIPYQMKPQLFRGSADTFTLQEASEDSSYFTTARLGRTLATGDVNRDGRMDLLANHLDAPVSLLLNESEASNWLQIELVGSVSDRDAVGAVVEVRCGDETFTAWQTGGDGYMCMNESMLHFGLGEHQQVEGISIRWPSGKREHRGGVSINRRHLIVEGLDA
jgi:hypothetical protein